MASNVERPTSNIQRRRVSLSTCHLVRPVVMEHVAKLGGLVLCGGHSKRMGIAKAWLPFGPERMLPRVVRLLSEAVAPIVVVAAQGQQLPDLPPGTTVARDQRSDLATR